MSLTADEHLAISHLVHRYADAVIHRNGVQWGSCWTDDATWDLGRAQVEGKAAILELWYGSMAHMAAVVQMVHSGHVERTGPDTAAGRWYIREWFSRTSGVTGILAAHYDDRYRLTDQGWQFTHRGLVPHYQGPSDLSGTFRNGRTDLEARGLTPDV